MSKTKSQPLVTFKHIRKKYSPFNTFIHCQLHVHLILHASSIKSLEEEEEEDGKEE